MTEARNLADVAVDDQLAKPLRGVSNGIYRAEMSENWAEAGDHVRPDEVGSGLRRRWYWTGRGQDRFRDCSPAPAI